MATHFQQKAWTVWVGRNIADTHKNNQFLERTIRGMTSLAATIITQFQTLSCTCVYYLTKTERVCWLIFHFNRKLTPRSNFKLSIGANIGQVWARPTGLVPQPQCIGVKKEPGTVISHLPREGAQVLKWSLLTWQAFNWFQIAKQNHAVWRRSVFHASTLSSINALFHRSQSLLVFKFSWI